LSGAVEDFGCRLLADGFQLLAVGFRLLAVGVPSAIPPRHCVALSPLTSSGAQESIEALATHPWTGVGKGVVQTFSSRLPSPESPFPTVRK